MSVQWVRAAGVLRDRGVPRADTLASVAQHFSSARLDRVGGDGAGCLDVEARHPLGQCPPGHRDRPRRVPPRPAGGVEGGRRAPGSRRAGERDDRYGLAALSRRSLVLAAIGGLRLAWVWYHRIATRPARGRHRGRSRTSRSAISSSGAGSIGLALCLLAPTEVAAGRGGQPAAGPRSPLCHARTRRFSRPAPSECRRRCWPRSRWPRCSCCRSSLGGLTLLGLADTWLDFRRRLATPATGGYDR